MKTLLNELFNGKSLSKEQAMRGMEILKSNEATPEQMGALLGALRAKGETPEEISGFASALLKDAVPVNTSKERIVDCCGTGGDGSNSFNISTTVALVLAAGGVPVAKHGNRSISSQCGSADVLEALNIAVTLEPEGVAESIEKNNFGFMFAPLFHPAIKGIMPVRKALGVRTVFNILGPLMNPARVKYQVLGVFDSSLILTMAEALRELGSVESMVVASADGLDEFSIADTTFVAHLKDGKITEFKVTPEELGLTRASLETLKGGNATENAEIIRKIFDGEKGPRRDVILLNAAAGFVVGGKVDSLVKGVEYAASVIDSGAAKTRLEELTVQ